jgi:hypothetical protein
MTLDERFIHMTSTKIKVQRRIDMHSRFKENLIAIGIMVLISLWVVLIR